MQIVLTPIPGSEDLTRLDDICLTDAVSLFRFEDGQLKRFSWPGECTIQSDGVDIFTIVKDMAFLLVGTDWKPLIFGIDKRAQMTLFNNTFITLSLIHI